MKAPLSIRSVDLASVNLSDYKKAFADSVVLTHDNKLLLQQKPLDWGSAPGCLTAFGGHIEAGETPMQALIRELHEELGAIVDPQDVINLGAVTEDFTGHTELVYLHFWHDKDKTITGCYEGEPHYYESVEQALLHPKIMDYLKFMLKECQAHGLVK